MRMRLSKGQEGERLTLRLPSDAKAFIERQAAHNFTSANAEIVRCIRERMKIEEGEAA
tara:strand:+ start:322 stop:495 length:174 start_codon:yes stop_codon:yes gene_type:complete